MLKKQHPQHRFKIRAQVFKQIVMGQATLLQIQDKERILLKQDWDLIDMEYLPQQ